MAKKKAKRKSAPAPKSKPKSKAKPNPRAKAKTKTKAKSRPAARSATQNRSATKKKSKPKSKVVKRPAAKATTPAKKKVAPSRKPAARKPAPAVKAPAPVRTAPPPPPVIATVDDYIRALPSWQAEVARAIRDIIHTAAPNSSESIRGGQPVYEEDGPICYFKSFSDHVTFGFWRGMEMPDPSNLLKGEGDRMRHVRLTMFDDVPREPLEEFVRNAVRLNREKGNPTLGR